MPDQTIPRAEFGMCGGSSTLSFDFPAGLEDDRIEVVADELEWDTPFGRSPAFTHFRVGGPHGARDVLAVRMHGWRRGVRRADASLQTFWVFDQAGVAKVVADGGVGSVNRLLDPRDVIVPDDFLDLSARQDIYVRGDHLLMMRDPVCPVLGSGLVAAASATFPRVFGRGVYAVTDGPRFESVAEVEHIARAGADVVGQSFAPEVFLARDIGACYAGIYLVVNYAEGVVKEWEHEELKDIFFDESVAVARCVVDVLSETDLDAPCGCGTLRKPSLLDIPDDRE
jgi:5'-methylthioadenosine phosphorylase